MSNPVPIVPDPAVPRPRRRWWAVSLRGLMVLILVVGGLIGWWVRGATLRREAVTTLREAGAVVTFRDEPGQEDKAGVWTWLYRRTGVEAFREVAGVAFRPPGMKASPPVDPAAPRPGLDETFRALGRLGRVGSVEVWLSAVTPAHLRELAGARVDRLYLVAVPEVTGPMMAEVARIGGLTDLQVNWPKTRMDPAILRAVAAMPRLERVELHGFAAPLTEADVAPLAALPGLRVLALSPAPRGEGYLDRIGAAGRLTEVWLGGTRISDAGLRRLVARSPGLVAISLDGAALTDAGVEALASLPQLTTLDLVGRVAGAPGGALTDASLATLGRLRALTTLGVTGGHFTDRGIDALQGLQLWNLQLGAIESIGPATLGRLLGRPHGLLSLRGPGVTDATVAILAASPPGKGNLDLSYSAVTDAGMATLAGVPCSGLSLIGTNITDRGLATLGAGTTARELVLWETAVTPEAADAFRAARQRPTLFIGPAKEDQ